MILESPGTSPSLIAHAHGFSAVEVAELLPIFLENLRTDFSSADGPAPALVPPAPQPDETPEEHADRYLSELAQNQHLDVVAYDTLAAIDGDLDGDDLDDDGLEDADLDDLGDGVTFPDPRAEIADLDDQADDHADDEVDDAAADQSDGDVAGLAEDDPFAAAAPPEAGTQDDSFDEGLPDEPGEPFAMS
jgi:hypothetical protein